MTTTYMFDKSNRTNIMSMQRQAISIIQSFFAALPSSKLGLKSTNTGSPALVGKPVFTVNADKVIVQLFYYAPTVTITTKVLLH